VAAAKENNRINMYTVFAELPGGSGALFANLVNGAILLTVRALNF
jgi:ATP-dependent Zn protease